MLVGKSVVALLLALLVGMVAIARRPERIDRFDRVEHDALEHVGAPHQLHWVDLDAEDVVLSCVDGRSDDDVIGTPGGDAGELLVLLAAAEAEGLMIAPEQIPDLIDAWIAEFGGFYLHTDRFVVLHGDHHERAILDVEADVDHDPALRHTIPMIKPHNAHDQVFVIQPQAIAVVRDRAVELLADRFPELDRAAVRAHVERLGAVQLTATLAHLDVHVPTIRVLVDHHVARSVTSFPRQNQL